MDHPANNPSRRVDHTIGPYNRTVNRLLSGFITSTVPHGAIFVPLSSGGCPSARFPASATTPIMGASFSNRMSAIITSRKLWLGLAGPPLFLGLFFLRTDLGELGDALAEANYWWVVPAVAIWFAAAVIRSLRWRYLLHGLADIKTLSLYPIVIIGYMANNLLPLRTGERVRADVVMGRHPPSKMATPGTNAAEGIFP